MSDEAPIYQDFDAYFATFDEKERQELAQAEAALELAIMLHRARKARGLTQKDAAARAGLRQQAISRWERSNPNVQIESLQKYLQALGYSLEIVIRDEETGEVLGTVSSPAGVETAVQLSEPEDSAPEEADTAMSSVAASNVSAKLAHSTVQPAWPSAAPTPGQQGVWVDMDFLRQALRTYHVQPYSAYGTWQPAELFQPGNLDFSFGAFSEYAASTFQGAGLTGNPVPSFNILFEWGNVVIGSTSLSLSRHLASPPQASSQALNQAGRIGAVEPEKVA